ncbi:MAG: 3-hydroxyacyl-CoA dehydrogenase NAD-binding domain-containing protein [Alphaproteobacteria bacterium]|nr:3-hydroxyacyl-CoA dehydrogenase NAD-binding domain-containing protein [Alphaproteobacteria bacterium]
MADVIGVVGAGRMGSGIAQACAQAGLNVVLVDIRNKSLAVALQAITDNLGQLVSDGKISAEEKNAALSRITTGTDFALLKSCSLCIEAVLENEGIKAYIHALIREKAGPDIIIATNTVNLPVARLANRVANPSSFLGVRFGFPPQTAPDVKIVPAPHTSREALSVFTQFLRRLGKNAEAVPDHKAAFRISLKTQVRLFTAVMALVFTGACWALVEGKSPDPIPWIPVTGLGIGFLALIVFDLMLEKRCFRLGQITHVMEGIASNDMSITVPDLEKQDEVGDMGRIIDIFKMITKDFDRLTDEEAKKAIAAVEKRQMFEKLAYDFDQSVGHIVDGLASEATQLLGNAKHLSEMADQTSRQSSTVAAASEEASASVQTVASAAEELSASISEINRQVSESSRVSSEAVEEVKRTNETVATLSDAAAQIGDVVKLIQAIAEQTNLLALNATIEAARAGEAGKGFAVVASEVKNLANQTARATEEISNKIVTVQSVSTQAVDAIRGIGTTIEKISQISGVISNAIEQQTSATKEISNNVQQAFTGISEVSSSILTVTHAATESNSAANEVMHASDELSQQADSLRRDVQSFLHKVKQG